MGENMKKQNLKQQAEEIIRLAEESGVQSHYFFLTTFERYQVQLGILADLERTIKEDGSLVTKEYVKGRENIYTHPAVSEYNRTTDSANRTAQTLMKIIKDLGKGKDDEEEEDPLMKLLNGDNE